MREAVIVSYARTGLAKSARGGFNITPTVSIAAHSVKHAVAKAGIEAESVEDVFMGNVAHGGGNIARQAGLLAGLPITTSGVTINRFCSSGLQTIGMAANFVRNDGADVVVAGGSRPSRCRTWAPARTTSIRNSPRCIRRSSCR
jgi:acetyl-CoA C-acetyltransferase